MQVLRAEDVLMSNSEVVNPISVKMIKSSHKSLIQSYPLYDILVEQVAERKEKNIDVGRLFTTINNLPIYLSYEEFYPHYKEIGHLILHHFIVTNNPVILPRIAYDAKVMPGNKGLLYDDVSNLPADLHQILAQYIEYHKAT